MEGILVFIGGVVFFLGIYWFWGEVVRPLRQLQRLIRELAEGKEPKGFVARGAWGLEESIGQLERVATRLEGVTSQGESERVNLQAILGSLTEGVLVSDREGKIVLANGQFLRMFDVEDVPRGRTVMEATRLIEVDRAVEEINAVGGMRGLEVQVPGSESRQAQTLAINMAAIVEGNQERSGVVVVFHDLSKLRRLEVVRQEFVTNLSHELRTPLSILAGYLETLEDPNQLKGSEGKKIWAVLQRNCERLTLLVGDLLELSRMDSGQLELKKIARSPREILQEVHEDWQRAFASKKVKLRLECPEKLPAVLVDSLRMGQIFSNLMENALRFAPEGSEVKLTGKQGESGHEIEFTVEDEGEGIPEDKIDRVFERFFPCGWGAGKGKGRDGSRTFDREASGAVA